MISWKKPLIEIIIVIILFSLLAELILGSTIGYGTNCRGRFIDGFYIEGEVDYDLKYMSIGGEDWVANFSDLSEVRANYYIEDESYQFNLQTSKLTIKPNGYGYIHLYGIINNSKLSSITFQEKRIWVILTSPQNRIVGTMLNITGPNELSNVIFITDTEIINASSGRGNFYLSGEDEETQYNISTGENYHLKTDTQNGDIVQLKGDLQGYNFRGSIWSNGRLYTSGNPKLSGDMELKILQNPETYYNHESHEYDWELDIEGDYEVVGGGGYPFWSFGLMLSAIPSIIIVAYHLHKKILNDRKKPPK